MKALRLAIDQGLKTHFLEDIKAVVLRGCPKGIQIRENSGAFREEYWVLRHSNDALSEDRAIDTVKRDRVNDNVTGAGRKWLEKAEKQEKSRGFAAK